MGQSKMTFRIGSSDAIIIYMFLDRVVMPVIKMLLRKSRVGEKYGHQH